MRAHESASYDRATEGHIALALSAGLAAGTADAATTTDNLGASTTVIGGNSATITTQPVAFPSYNSVNTVPTDGQGNVGVAATSRGQPGNDCIIQGRQG